MTFSQKSMTRQPVATTFISPRQWQETVAIMSKWMDLAYIANKNNQVRLYTEVM